MTQLDLPRIAADLLVAHRPALAEAAGGPDHCVLFTRMAVDACRERGVLARPLAVSVELRGEDQADPEFRLGFQGDVPMDAPPDFWDGHLVAVLDRRLMVDLSLDSATRPEFGFTPAPLVADVLPQFLEGGSMDVAIEGGTARYFANPDRKDYQDLPAWEQGTPDAIARLAEALLDPPRRNNRGARPGSSAG